MRMIVAVTGAGGFIGRHLCAAFRAHGHEVREIVRADFDGRLSKLIDGSDVVVHAAAATRAPTREALRGANVELTETVLAAANAAKVSRFVYISSQAAAGPAANRDTPVTEGDQPAPVEEYGRSKRDAELLVASSGLPFTIVRPASVYGPGDRDFLALFRLAKHGLAIHPGNREQWISIVHVHDCVQAIVTAATTPRAARMTYFIANAEPVQWRQVFELARTAAGASNIADVEIPMPIVEAGAMFGDALARFTGHAGLFTSEKVKLGKPPFWVCSNAKAVAELGFAETRGLAEGIAETLRWYQDNGWL
jgi:nucleoside-diphosphate-sugar epimerase